MTIKVNLQIFNLQNMIINKYLLSCFARADSINGIPIKLID